MKKLTHTINSPRLITTLFSIVFALAIISSIVTIIQTRNAAAAPVQGFNAGKIIDDSVFTDTSTMSAQQIQSFLNSKVSHCDTWGTQPSEFGGGTRRQWAESRGNSAPFTCLKDYSENGRSASQIIYDIGQEFSINPQVLIVLLQKEQSLVTDTWPIAIQYKTATGYGCPDTAPCDSQYFGLTNQLRWAARMFRAILNNSPTWYTPYVLGNNYVQYSPNAACGGSTINIQNRSTQALYNYTPYQPNQSALNAGWGTATCGAYGNRNFFLYFTQWFGSTTGPAYAWTVQSSTVYTDSNFTQIAPVSNGTYYLQPGQKAYVKISGTNVGRTTWNTSNTRLGTFKPLDYQSKFHDSTWISKHRIVGTKEATVKPYDTVNYEFVVNAPTTPGSYTEEYSTTIEGTAWTSNAHVKIPIIVSTPIADSKLNSENNLPAGSTLLRGESIFSPEKNSILKLQPNGNLELYTNFARVWSSNTAGKGATRLVNQADGNLVLYSPSGAVWSSGTHSAGQSKLVLQTDANLVLYGENGPAWSSGTSTSDQKNIVNHKLRNTNTLHKGQSLTTPDRKFNLVLQQDGNLVLYSSTRALWSSGTHNKNTENMIMQNDGNLVLYDKNGRAVWSSNSHGNGASTLVVQDDANLVLYSSSKATWSSGTYQK